MIDGVYLTNTTVLTITSAPNPFKSNTPHLCQSLFLENGMKNCNIKCTSCTEDSYTWLFINFTTAMHECLSIVACH